MAYATSSIVMAIACSPRIQGVGLMNSPLDPLSQRTCLGWKLKLVRVRAGLEIGVSFPLPTAYNYAARTNEYSKKLYTCWCVRVCACVGVCVCECVCV